ncbi:MAG TPA: hypothetical protein VIQ00_14880 [Chitinophagaceae bacterium]|jgi:hypothetical protein
MKFFLSEKNIVVILFVMVVVIFSFAQKESKKIEHLYLNSSVTPTFKPTAKVKAQDKPVFSMGLQYATAIHKF